MIDAAAIGLRFGLYLNLMLLFGLAAFPLYSRAAPLPCRRCLVAAAVVGLGLNIAAFAVMMAQMAGGSLAALDGATLRFVLAETAPGTAFLVRTAALVAATAFAVRAGWPVAGAAALALATLAWTGHAAVTEGGAGTLHRAADIAHLLAAGAWIGALATMLGMTMGGRSATDLHAALTGFAVAGSVLVGTIVVTGLVNGGMIVAVDDWVLLPDTLYGQLMAAKLALFALMLTLAAANRWWLSRRLALSGNAAIPAVRTSIAIETAAAVAILALVAWLGTLAPPAAS